MGEMTLKWDPKNLEIRTMSVEKTLEPLVVQVINCVGGLVEFQLVYILIFKLIN